MKSFQFPLQRVFEWRGLQMRSEEERLAGMQHQLATLVHRETALTAAEVKSSLGLMQQAAISGSDLQSLAAYQLRMKAERAALKLSRVQCEHQILEQRKTLLKARRNFRVLEKLRENRMKEWVYLYDRETENMAADAYIAKWVRTEGEMV